MLSSSYDLYKPCSVETLTGEEIILWILHKIVILFFSANVLQCNIAFDFVHVQVSPARVAAYSIKRIYASGWFVRMKK